MFDNSSLVAPLIIQSTEGESDIQLTAPFKDRKFSNSWTLSGEHTASGKPLMANDPQLPQTTPGFWQFQHHTINGRKIAGGSLPGHPGIIVGHNNKLSWAITAAGFDVRDAAYVEIDPDNPDHYRRGPNEAWQNFNLRVENIHVRFGKDLVETIRSTNQGVTVPSSSDRSGLLRREGLAFEIRDVSMDQVSSSPSALLGMNRARNVDEGLQAMEAFISPALNISLADVNGDIAYVAAGRIPLRPESHARTIGLAPEDDNERSYLPYQENPMVINPPSGRIVTANQKIIGKEFPYYLTDNWAVPYRAWRIHELLDQKEIHNVDSFVSMQMDSLSPAARDLVPLMLEVQAADNADAQLVEMLQAWDYRFPLDAEAPVIWLTWVEFLKQQIVADDTAAAPPTWTPMFYSPVIRALSGEHPEWCDVLGSSMIEDCADALQKSLTNTRLALETAFGPDPKNWKWGEVAKFQLPHIGFAGLPILDRMFSRYTPIPGGPESNFTNSINLLSAPVFDSTFFVSSFQGIYDLSDLDASLFMIGGGASGHFKSPYYNNLTDDWITGKRMKLSPDEVEPIAIMTLVPEQPGG